MKMKVSDFSVKATVGEILEGWRYDPLKAHGLYVFTGVGRCLYVGISQDPVMRVFQHLGQDGRFCSESTIGQIVNAYRPESLDWLIYFPTGLELFSYLQGKYKDVDLFNWDSILKRVEWCDASSVASLSESLLIQELQCPVNDRMACQGVDFSGFWDEVNDKTAEYLSVKHGFDPTEAMQNL